MHHWVQEKSLDNLPNFYKSAPALNRQ